MFWIFHSDRQNDSYHGRYKFEQYLTSATPQAPPDTSAPVNENEEFCCLFRSKVHEAGLFMAELSNLYICQVGGMSLVYGAEMDAYDSKEKVHSGEKLKPEKFVEMKTSRIVENERQDRTFRRFKILKW